MKNKISILVIALSFGIIACNNSAKNKKEDINTHEIIESVIEEINTSNTFDSVLQSLPLRPIPLVEKTNFDNIKNTNEFSVDDIKSFQLSKIYPNIDKEGYNYKFQPAYKLALSDQFHTIILNVFKGENELETILIIYDSDNKLSQYYNQEGKLTTNSLVIAYDEIAEGWSRKHAELSESTITIINEFYGNTTQIDSTKFHINKDGYINEIKTQFSSSLRPNETILLNKVYTDTIVFNDYNDDGDYALLIGKKNEKEVILIYSGGWETIEKYNFKYGDYLNIEWKMDTIYIAGEGDEIDFKETVINAKRIETKSKPVKFLWRADKDDLVLDQTYNDIVINQSFVKSITNQEKAALGYVASFIGNECDWDGKANEDRSNLKCKIITALNLGYQCSDAHFGFLKRWFSEDEKALKKLESCVTMPESATVQTTFNKIVLFTDKDKKTIKVSYKVQGVNMRESKSWNYTQTDLFKYDSKNIWLINSEKSKPIEETLNDNPDGQPQNSAAKVSKSFTISCGSGCAMNYSENRITTKGDSNEVVFKVEMYINEKLTEEYAEAYVFTCDKSKKVSQIKRKGDADFEIENQHAALQKNLNSYVQQLCK